MCALATRWCKQLPGKGDGFTRQSATFKYDLVVRSRPMPACELWKKREQTTSSTTGSLHFTETPAMSGAFPLQHVPDMHCMLHDLAPPKILQSENLGELPATWQVAAYSVGELAQGRERRQMVQELWRRTGDILVIIEPGTPSGSALVRAAREQARPSIVWYFRGSICK